MNHHQDGKSLKRNSKIGLFNNPQIKGETIIGQNVQANR
jgi:hypothetical protein